MTKQKQEKLVDFKIGKTFAKIFLAGFSLLGILPFSFGQEFNLRNTIETRFKGQYHTEIFTEFLDSMETNATEYFEINCSQKACLIRNRGRAVAYKRQYEESYNYYFKAYEYIKNCEDKNPNIYLQILMSLDRFKDYKTNQDITPQIVIDEILSLVNNKSYYTNNEEFDKLSANAYYILCDYYRYNLIDFDRALIYGRKSLSIHNKYPIINSKPLRAFHSIINTFIAAQKGEEALPYITQALGYAKELNITEDRYTSDLQFRMGAVYLDTEDYERLDSIHNAISIDNPERTFYQTSYQKGLAAFNQDQYEKAKLNFKKTIKILNETGDKSQQTLFRDIYFFLADCNINLENFEAAYDLSIKSMKASTSQLKINNSTKEILLDDLIILSPLDFVKSANKYLESISEGNMVGEKAFINIIDQLDSIYFEIQPTLIGPLAANSIADSYHRMVGITLKEMENYSFERNKDFITYYLSSGKSLSLFSNFIIEENIADDELKTYNKLVSQRDQLASEIETTSLISNQKKLDSLSNKHYENNEQLKKFYINLNKKNLTYQYRDNRYKIINKLDSEFNSNELVIDYFYYDKQFYVYTYFNKTIRFDKIELEEIKDEDFKSFYTDINRTENLENLISELSNSLSTLLPEDPNMVTSLIIIPDGPLLEIPFETILYKGKELIHHFPIHYLNSINDHNKRRSLNIDAKNSYSGFGLSYNKELINNINSSKDIKSLFDNTYTLASLPNAVEELKTSNNIFNGDLFLEDQCSKENFIKHSPQSNIIHIANHVLLNNRNSFLSSIVFAKENKEELFNALEIKALNLNAQLAILSSCNSGVGENFSGNGLRSLGQSFFEAGCQSVIVNLWEAGDKSSKKIISSFMNYLNEGMPKSEALRKAKIDFIAQASDSEKHPKYWANIVLIGNDDPIRHNSGFPKWIYLIGGIVILFLGWRIFRKRKEAV